MKQSFAHIETWRLSIPPSTPGTRAGAFQIPLRPRVVACIIATDGTDGEDEEADWEHVSVHIRDVVMGRAIKRLATWDEMCLIKSIFWDDEEAVVQFHPSKADYVNQNIYVLHLWRWTKAEFPKPPKICV